LRKWVKVSKGRVLAAGGKGVLSYYKGSFPRALFEIYPTLRSQLPTVTAKKDAEKEEQLIT